MRVFLLTPAGGVLYARYCSILLDIAHQKDKYSMNTEWLTLNEAASYLKLGKSTLYRMVKEGRLPAQKVGRTWRFDRLALDSYLKNGKLSNTRDMD